MLILRTPTAPNKILEHTKNIALNESGTAPRIEVDPVAVSDESGVGEKISSQGPRVCILSGTHKTTYAGFRAFAKKDPDAGILILSARTGCKKDCFLRKLVSEGLIDKRRIILFGTRTWSGEEKEFLENNNIRYFTMKQVNLTGLSDVIDGITETIRSWHSLYLSIDMGIADPSCAPGTRDAQPGGLTARQFIYLIQRLKLLKNMRMCDLVEVDSDKDIDDMTVKLAAKMLVELA